VGVLLSLSTSMVVSHNAHSIITEPFERYEETTQWMEQVGIPVERNMSILNPLINANRIVQDFEGSADPIGDPFGVRGCPIIGNLLCPPDDGPVYWYDEPPSTPDD